MIYFLKKMINGKSLLVQFIDLKELRRDSEVSITYKFDFETAKEEKTDSKTKMKKFHVDDIQDMVGGLWEVDSKINKDKTDYEVVSRFG